MRTTLLSSVLAGALLVSSAATATASDQGADRGADHRSVTTVDAGRRAVVKVRLHAAPRRLRVAREVRRGYDRDKFVHWISQGDGCDTRDRVLIAEARRAPVVSADCTLAGGRWFSYYDGVRTSDPSTFDIDHLVPLAEAWDSGARGWGKKRRQRFANDVGDRRSLVAVSASSNRSKSDQDPREWMPGRQQCRYLREWVAVKLRWSLAVDRGERRFLVGAVQACPDTRLRVPVAP